MDLVDSNMQMEVFCIAVQNGNTLVLAISKILTKTLFNSGNRVTSRTLSLAETDDKVICFIALCLSVFRLYGHHLQGRTLYIRAVASRYRHVLDTRTALLVLQVLRQPDDSAFGCVPHGNSAGYHMLFLNICSQT